MEWNDMLSSFTTLHSQGEVVNVANLLCTRIQKTIDAVGRLSSRRDEAETLLSVLLSL